MTPSVSREQTMAKGGVAVIPTHRVEKPKARSTIPLTP
jgi:hypothetical protein